MTDEARESPRETSRGIDLAVQVDPPGRRRTHHATDLLDELVNARLHLRVERDWLHLRSTPSEERLDQGDGDPTTDQEWRYRAEHPHQHRKVGMPQLPAPDGHEIMRREIM